MTLELTNVKQMVCLCTNAPSFHVASFKDIFLIKQCYKNATPATHSLNFNNNVNKNKGNIKT